MLPREVTEILHEREFVSVATCDLKGRPNAAPKFLLKIVGNSIYLVDYTIGKSWENIKINPRISISFMDQHSLRGYQLNGTVKIIDKGPEFKDMCDEMTRKEVRLTAKRIIEDVRGEKKHENFEVLITEKFVILEASIKEAVEIGPKGEVRRNSAQ